MIVYVFGNQDFEGDTVALDAVKKLEGNIPEVSFETVNPGEDLPFADKPNVVLLDAIDGIKEITLLDETNLDMIKATKSVSVHDFDLGFQLTYLQKLGKLNKVTIIGLPMNGDVDYLRIQSILRKLVEQDMHGS